MEDLKTCLLGYWRHSHEEDTPNVIVYRPAKYKFPRSRGRKGFEFREDGTLIYHGIAEADGTEKSIGRWMIEASNRVRIDVGKERIPPFVLEVLSCDAKALKVRR